MYKHANAGQGRETPAQVLPIVHTLLIWSKKGVKNATVINTTSDL